jgi:uncharacterized protein YgiM (DUF1202 family)
MKNKLFSIFCLLGLVCCPISAKSVYVYDKAKLWSRTGPSNQFKVYLPLLPGTRLEVIGENTETSYTQVRDVKQREFWVKSDFLTSKPTANILLSEALNKIDKLSQQHTTNIQALERKIKTMQPLESINQKLQTKIAKMNIEMEQLKQSNSAMSTGFYRDVFFAGGVTILVGILFGWFFSLRGRKRNDAWS